MRRRMMANGSWIVHTTGLPDGYVPPSASLSSSPSHNPIATRETTVADNRLDEALDIVARYFIAHAIDNADDQTMSYCDIGEHDWREIAVRATELAPYPDRAQYEAAYGYLTERAEGEA